MKTSLPVQIKLGQREVWFHRKNKELIFVIIINVDTGQTKKSCYSRLLICSLTKSVRALDWPQEVMTLTRVELVGWSAGRLVGCSAGGLLVSQRDLPHKPAWF